MDFVNCLIGFANNKSSVEVSLKAIALLRISENRLSEVWLQVLTNRNGIVGFYLNLLFLSNFLLIHLAIIFSSCFQGLVPVGSLKFVEGSVDETRKLAEHYWLPMLIRLSKLVSDPRSEVSNGALEVLFDLLNERGSKFSSSFWENIFQEILFPIFDHVRHAGKENLMSSVEEWLRESTIHALQLLCDLFNSFYKVDQVV